MSTNFQPLAAMSAWSLFTLSAMELWPLPSSQTVLMVGGGPFSAAPARPAAKSPSVATQAARKFFMVVSPEIHWMR